MAGRVSASTLKSVPMAAGPGEPFDRRIERGARCRIGIRAKLPGALHEPERVQERALRHGAMRSGAFGRSAPPKRGEVYMRGQVGGTWRGQRFGEAMAAHRLQSVAGGGLGMAIVHDERRTIFLCDSASDLRDDRVGRRADLKERALRRDGSPVEPARADSESELPGIVEADDTLSPLLSDAHELAHRKRVEELVGDEKKRAQRDVGERVRAK